MDRAFRDVETAKSRDDENAEAVCHRVITVDVIPAQRLQVWNDDIGKLIIFLKCAEVEAAMNEVG